MVFLKAPRKGTVKTRLAKDVGNDVAALLYRHFVLDVLDILKTKRWDIAIQYDPPGSARQIRQWLGPDFRYAPQRGSGLGKRMRNAFESAFADGVQRAILIGTDAPDLPSRFIHRAEKALQTVDAVLGPCRDGGYYLIGFTREGFAPAVFTGIPWSTSRVFQLTERALNQRGRRFHVLPIWQDIDNIADLHELARRCRTNGGAARTQHCLSQLRMTVPLNPA